MIDVCVCLFPYVSVSQSLVVDLIQDDHSIRGHRFLPRDVHYIFCHLVLDGTSDIISFVCGEQMVSWIVFLFIFLSKTKEVGVSICPNCVSLSLSFLSIPNMFRFQRNGKMPEKQQAALTKVNVQSVLFHCFHHLTLFLLKPVVSVEHRHIVKKKWMDECLDKVSTGNTTALLEKVVSNLLCLRRELWEGWYRLHPGGKRKKKTLELCSPPLNSAPGLFEMFWVTFQRCHWRNLKRPTSLGFSSHSLMEVWFYYIDLRALLP